MDYLNLVNRTAPLFEKDILANEKTISKVIPGARFLVVGGAGSIGQAVVKEIFKRRPRALHVVDISENNMVELVRDIRSTLGYIDGDFSAFAIDSNSPEFEAFCRSGSGYDYVLNLSAMKHVRSEKDPYTLMRLINVNVINSVKLMQHAVSFKAKKYFCVSTDKAANPVNMMGASKKIMEMFLMRASHQLPVSSARFANVAFSDGSLLHGFNQRFAKKQPFAAPRDVRRYFITPKESGELCLLACLLGDNRDIFFPKLSDKLHLTTFSDIAVKYLTYLGYEAVACASEEEARGRAEELIRSKKWPCYFFDSDTTGEKDFEEFFTSQEDLDSKRFADVGVIRNKLCFEEKQLSNFVERIEAMIKKGQWSKLELVELFSTMLPDFDHKETGKYLDGKM